MLRLFASLKLTVGCLLWLTVLTLWGTIYQVDHGIYLAQHRFFFSWVFLAGGFVPLPGAMLTLFLLFVNLVVSFFMHYQAGWRMPGLMLIHIGLILMLLGGFFTKLTGVEAKVSLFEGEGRNVAVSNSEWELSFSDDLKSVQEFQAVEVSDLRKGRKFSFRDSDLEFKVLKIEDHIAPMRPIDRTDPPEGVASPSGLTVLQPAKKPQEPGQWTPGIRLAVTGAQGVEEIVLTAFDTRPVGLQQADGHGRFLMLRPKRYELPLFMELNDFRRTYYPGTDTPKDYRSLITVHVGEDQEREVVIKMNEPFRWHGWTFYQQSFAVRDDDSEMSVFAVTRNFGRLIPYWATGITSAGLALHFLQMQMMQLKRRRKSA